MDSSTINTLIIVGGVTVGLYIVSKELNKTVSQLGQSLDTISHDHYLDPMHKDQSNVQERQKTSRVFINSVGQFFWPNKWKQV